MPKSKKIYLCDSCGNEFLTWSGRCEMCGEWNSLKEISTIEASGQQSSKNQKAEIKDLHSIKIENNIRISTGISEFDRVLGGGIVKGSVILLGGEPGIGKSTIALELAKHISDILFISAEESLSQVKIRAERIGVKGSGIKLASGGNLEILGKEIIKRKPTLLVVDSIQTVYLGSVNSTPGSLSQVREAGIFLQRLAKQTGISVLIVGHVTKEGNIAGPRLLEHIVDAVLYLEGERYHDARILRGIKNRFGPTDETGVFNHTEKGLVEIKNPSKLFLAEKGSNPGSAVVVTLEGTRPLLVEVQALTIATNFGYPKRTSAGFSLNRLNLLAAVISKNTPINLSNFDVYVKVVGGVNLKEPAVDLGVCAAIISSYKNQSLPNDITFFGEVGLSGEIRSVTKEKQREKEAKSLGYRVYQNKNSRLRGLIEILS